MELTQQCLEEIILAARESANGTLVITVQSRPEDSQSFDFKCNYETRFRVTRNGRQAIPTEGSGKSAPNDKFS
jgi:hypothetical protein